MGKCMIHNPVIWADVPDVDVIRVGDTYYMASTSMHTMPGCPIMKSKDLKNWEIINYVYDRLENNDEHNLVAGKNIYGKGAWAASLREHKGIFYVCFSSNDTNQFYMYKTNDIEKGKWERHIIDGLMHDPGLLFDENRVFVIYGNGDLYIKELTPDATAIKPDGIHQLLVETKRDDLILRAEGCHVYKLRGYYYLLLIDWPTNGNRRRRIICYRSKELLGSYERKVILDDDMGYRNQGVAQGGMVDTIHGKTYGVFFQDHDAVGRIPIVVPVEWIDDWPTIGVDGKVPECFEIDLPESPARPMIVSDDFHYKENRLALHWQWNHNPNDTLWSVTERKGYLRLKTGELVDGVLQARNTLTQRTEGPACKNSVKIDLSNMVDGDHAGLVALQYTFGTIGVKIKNDEKFVVMCVNDGTGKEKEVASLPYQNDVIYVKIEYNFEQSVDQARFFYSADNEDWLMLGDVLQLKYGLEHFMGCRTGLFNYASLTSGGYADFTNFTHEKLVAGQYQLIKQDGEIV